MSGGRSDDPSVERNRLLTLEESLDVTDAYADITNVKHSVAGLVSHSMQLASTKNSPGTSSWRRRLGWAVIEV